MSAIGLSPGQSVTGHLPTGLLAQTRSNEQHPKPSGLIHAQSLASQTAQLDDLVHVLCHHAAERPDRAAFIHLSESRPDGDTLTYAQLDLRARAVAGHLQGMGLSGERVALAYPNGLDFITGFFGCLFAGCVAVPMYPPHRRTIGRFHGIIADADARLILSTAPLATHYQAMSGAGGAGPTPAIPWLITDHIPDDSVRGWVMPAITPDTLAMLQYTSGSTSVPKGVMVSHANLMSNTHAIGHAFEIGADLGLFWLPPYHDMGLVGGILVPILAGGTSMLMSPEAFLREPSAWLAAISKYRATISGAPSFAYDLCVRKTTAEQRASLDLSCWNLAFLGAEPIAPETLERFVEAFAVCGFKPTALYPCYGMAEATLLISGSKRGDGADVRAFNEVALAHGRVEPVHDVTSKARRLVSCGKPLGDLSVLIVDVHTDTQAPAGVVGEIWVSGASVGQGYWRKPDLTHDAFGARLSDTGEGPFLRTGDLGFMFEGMLYVTGRRDDLLIVRGKNHHPQDLETTVRGSHALLEAGLGAAFAVEEAGDQRLIMVQEVTRGGDMDFTPALQAARMAVLEEHGLLFDAIILVRGGTIPRTSSGKVQRRACRKAFLAGELKVVAEHRRPASSPQRPARHVSESLVLATVCQHAVDLGGAALSDVTPDTPLAALGLDSLQRVELAATLEKAFACRLPDTDFNPAQTIGELAHAVQTHLSDLAHPEARTREIPPEHYEFARFPEYNELRRYERMLTAVTGTNPYFRVDQGGATPPGVTRIGGRDLMNFSAYDYLGLARDPQVVAAAKAAIDRFGTGAGASRLVSGEKQVHRELELALASFLGTAAAIVFVSGHATNVTTIGHLFGAEDLIVHDILAHNSIIQGAQLSGATRRVFPHNDWRTMDTLLSEVRHRYRRVLIAIEGVYSMDGDCPDLPRFVEMKRKHKAMLLIDEAHSLGTMGATGRGIAEHYGVARTDADLWMGTLSKSLAGCGGYIAGSAELVEYLGYTAPGFVYSVGMSPPNAASALAALSVLRNQPQRVSRLRELSALFLELAKEHGLNTGSAAGTPVVPVIVGNSVKSLRLAQALFERGINVQPILHPAVPEHAARLRFFITTNHNESQIRTAVSTIADELARL